MKRVALWAALCAVLGAPSVAAACGGFFCSAAAPVFQAGEQILFSRDDQDRLLVYVQIQYAGPSEDFSWILPVPGVPEVGVGTDALFTAIEPLTRPAFQVNQVGEGCDFGGGDGFGCGSDELSMADGGGWAPNEGDPGVRPVERGSAGPYDYVVLEATDPEELTTWLTSNGYDLPGNGDELLRLYVDGEHHFVAVRLRKDREAGDIVPIVLRFDEALPCVPLRLTAVAATPNMPVTVYVLGEHRSVPQNWAEVELNWARLDWFSGGANYVQLVTEAVDAAPGGQGFVTEYAGDTSMAVGTILPPRVSAEGFSYTSSAALVNTLSNAGFFTQAEIARVLDRVEDPWNPDEMRAVVETELIAPRREAQELVDRARYLTRLYTTVSPEEMTTDPVFTFDAELPDVPALREATVEVQCVDGEDRAIIKTPDGDIAPYPVFATPDEAGQGPAARRVIVRDEAERPEVLVDNTLGQVESEGGCRTDNRGLLWVGLPLAVLVFFARRRR